MTNKCKCGSPLVRVISQDEQHKAKLSIFVCGACGKVYEQRLRPIKGKVPSEVLREFVRKRAQRIGEQVAQGNIAPDWDPVIKTWCRGWKPTKVQSPTLPTASL